MMKTLIVYLSATGNTERVAKEIAQKIEGSKLYSINLKTKIPKSNFWVSFKFGFLMSINWGFRYSLPSVDLDEYDQVIIGSPVWMGRAAPPVIKVIKKLKISNKIRGVFVTCGSSAGYVFEDICKRTSIDNIENKLVLTDTEIKNDNILSNKSNIFIKGLKSLNLTNPQTILYER